MGKKYLVIGGSSGIGDALVEQLLQREEEVAVISRNEGDLSDKVEFHSSDVCDFEKELPDVEEIRGLVYLPGTINLRPFKQLSLEDFEKDLKINYLGAVRAVQHYAPKIKGDPNGSIVLISTVAVGLGMPFHTSISGAKGALQGFALSLAAELAPKVRVNVVSPSLTDTPLAEKLLDSDTKRENLSKRHPLQSVGEPGDIASMIRFLLSDEAKWITGQVMHVDGGLSTLKL